MYPFASCWQLPNTGHAAVVGTSLINIVDILVIQKMWVELELSENLTIRLSPAFHAVKRPSSKDIEQKQISDITQGLQLCYK